VTRTEPYRFTRAEADQLAAEFRSGVNDIYDLRHTFRVALLSAGIPLVEVIYP